ncbi:MAG: CvpA family protein [Dehalococcoidia bacterium]
MNWLDLLIVGVLAWTTFRAFTTGLIREVVTLVGLIAGIALSGAFYDDLSANLEFVISDSTTRSLAAFAAIFIGTMIAAQVLSAVLRTASSLLLLGPLDRIGGAAFGLVKGLLLVQVLLAAVSVFPAQATVARAVADSKIAPVLLRYSPAIRFGLPQEFQDPLGQLRRLQSGDLPGLIPATPSPTAKP